MEYKFMEVRLYLVAATAVQSAFVEKQDEAILFKDWK